MNSAAVAATSAIFVAIVGAAGAYINNKVLQRRNDRLERLNAQLSELYGPLVMYAAANRIAFREFERRYVPKGEKLFDKPPKDETRRLWMIWVENVFMPNNRHVLELLESKGHLLIEDHVPPVLLQFVAHTFGYEALLVRWHEQDFGEYLSVVNFPDELDNYAQTRFLILKSQQLKLLRNHRVLSLGALGKDPEEWKRYHEKIDALPPPEQSLAPPRSAPPA